MQKRVFRVHFYTWKIRAYGACVKPSMVKLCFESPFTRMISSLRKSAPRARGGTDLEKGVWGCAP